MCRNAARLRLRAAFLALALLAALGWTADVRAETVSSPQMTGVEMTAPVRQTLKQIEEQWLQWITAFHREDVQLSDGLIADLLATAQQLGMQRLPDLSIGASAAAVKFAREKDFARARLALQAAERLDPGRPEAAFAAASVSRLEGGIAGLPRAVSELLRGYLRLFRLPLERSLWLQDVVIWSFSLLLLTGGLFIAVQMVAKGKALCHDLIGLFSRWLPRSAAVAAAAVFLLWPLVLPYGALWLPLFWSVLIWGYGSTSERSVLIALWLLIGLAPVLIAEQRRQVAVELSPPVQAMESLEQHRLYGGLFMDLGVLRSLLPESPAVKHLLADLHRSLNQWDLARSLYRQVLEAEPENTSVLINLGAYFFLKGDFGNAIQSFQKATASEPSNVAAHFNLSQAYSESYLFDESKRSLAQARALDGEKVDAWFGGRERQRVVATSTGMTRIPEIRRELLAGWQPEAALSPNLELLRRGLSVIVALGLILVAVALHFARRPFGYGEKRLDLWVSGRSLDRLRRALLPGFSSARAGEGARAFFAILLPMGFLMLPLLGGLGYRIPWGYDPGNLISWIVSILGLLLYFGARLRSELRNDV